MEEKINNVEVFDTQKENITGETFDGGVTEEQIKQWKGKYGKIVRIDVVDDGDLHVGYFHRPRLDTISAVTRMAKSDEMRSSEVLYDNCWLGGSVAMRKDAVLFLQATKQLGTMLNSCRSSIKNL